MYLRTPKRYTAKGRRRYLFNLRWLWLYILFPIALIPLLLIWNEREMLSQRIGDWASRNIRIDLNPPTPTPTVPAADLRVRYLSYMQAGEVDEAIATLWRMGDLAPNDEQLFATLARLIALRGDPDDKARHAELLRAATAALNADPESAEGWIASGLAYNSSGNPQLALPYLLRARDLEPRNPMLLAVLADTYNDLDRPDDASRYAAEAIELAKASNPIDVTALAYAYVVQGNVLSRTSGAEAIRAYEEAWRVAQSEPTAPRGYIAQWIAGYYLNRADSDKAIPVLQEAFDRDRDDPINPYLLGRIYLNRGDPNRARTYLERCRDIQPEQIKCLRWLGTVLYRAQNYQRAAEIALQAIQHGSQDPAAYLVAGLSLSLLNRCGEALPLLREGARLDADGALASQFQDGLRRCSG
ncbi:MAG: tetratricopeptide repeat protein [Chloroflexi bacterium]|jgi:tetratricopeptide (TPR) repeat protein|nr:tetratricopeptide repeat protein [Chloroflexota bacterium]